MDILGGGHYSTYTEAFSGFKPGTKRYELTKLTENQGYFIIYEYLYFSNMRVIMLKNISSLGALLSYT